MYLNSIIFDPFPDLIDFPPINHPQLKTLPEFHNLEELSIDCHFIYPERDHDEADRLITLLPPSTRKFRISYVYEGIYKSLYQLAGKLPKVFPLLEDAIVGIGEKTYPRYDYGIEKQ
ncbi:hypothetical protein F4813DRAFT_373726 [Daldinia decipiens]|uniref:uncharacterized protein n=1 Tax=Daldinia decipiens TaxID=326647 RepID=UPI0020C4802B|nr:uncharacterized protein F4813DRAFT_373726 [Daldinia decipiens]KAI1653693.1 hypothetical protein F4813DRAFT_373726 [Daldinia decipiens]